MNRNRRPIPAQLRKKMEKNSRQAQKKLSTKEEPPRSHEITPKKLTKRFPNINPSLIKKTKLTMEIKKKKKEHKRSKRTTPGPEIEVRESSPAHIHPEGERWQKTLDLQNKINRKRLTAKLRKRTKIK